MTDTKKKAQKGARGKDTRAQLKARAAEIIGDVRTFDADTRRAVWLALNNLNFAETDPPEPTKYTEPGYCERELRKVIEKAEAGVAMFEAERFAPGVVDGAFAVYRMLEPRDDDAEVPDFIINAARVALEATAERYGVRLWLDVDGSGDAATGGLSVAAIAYLFERAGTHGVEVEPARDLAGLISGVLTHDETPSRIYNALSEAVADFTSKDEVQNRPEVIRAALAVHKAGQEEEGGES